MDTTTTNAQDDTAPTPADIDKLASETTNATIATPSTSTKDKENTTPPSRPQQNSLPNGTMGNNEDNSDIRMNSVDRSGEHHGRSGQQEGNQLVNGRRDAPIDSNNTELDLNPLSAGILIAFRLGY